MATRVETSFSRFSLTEEEQLNGSIFTPEQLYVLQNRLADAAEEKLALIFDPSNPSAFIQAEAESQGKIRLLQDLILTSNEATQIRTDNSQGES